jgi:hypothetical protein
MHTCAYVHQGADRTLSSRPASDGSSSATALSVPPGPEPPHWNRPGSLNSAPTCEAGSTGFQG